MQTFTIFARNNSASDSYNSYTNNYDEMHTVFAVDSFIRIAYGNESFTFYNRPNNVIGSMLVHSYFFNRPLYTHIVLTVTPARLSLKETYDSDKIIQITSYISCNQYPDLGHKFLRGFAGGSVYIKFKFKSCYCYLKHKKHSKTNCIIRYNTVWYFTPYSAAKQ